MHLIDKVLSRRSAEKRLIRVGIVGAGSSGGSTAHQILRHIPGMTLAAISNRTPEKAKEILARAQLPSAPFVRNQTELEDAIRKGIPSYTDDAQLLCRAEGDDVILEATGTIDFASGVCLSAFQNGTTVVSINPELEATLGPILNRYANDAGVIFSGSDGDQPGVTLNLVRFVSGTGLKPLLCGNVKALQDRYRTPETQAEFAKTWDQNVKMVTSFADGTKISFEQAAIANATGMTVTQRGMIGRQFNGHIDELTNSYDVDELVEIGGAVDYVVGARPGPGVFVFGTTGDPHIQKYLKLYKLGDGPLYSFYTPYHLCFLEVPNSIVRVVEFKDPVMAPLGGPVVEVISKSKRPLKAGETIDGMGGFTIYGEAEKSKIARSEDLLPVGMAEGCQLLRDIPADTPVTFSDVKLPPERLCDRLWREHCAIFNSSSQSDGASLRKAS